MMGIAVRCLMVGIAVRYRTLPPVPTSVSAKVPGASGVRSVDIEAPQHERLNGEKLFETLRQTVISRRNAIAFLMMTTIVYSVFLSVSCANNFHLPGPESIRTFYFRSSSGVFPLSLITEETGAKSLIPWTCFFCGIQYIVRIFI